MLLGHNGLTRAGLPNHADVASVDLAKRLTLEGQNHVDSSARPCSEFAAAPLFGTAHDLEISLAEVSETALEGAHHDLRAIGIRGDGNAEAQVARGRANKVRLPVKRHAWRDSARRHGSRDGDRHRMNLRLLMIHRTLI